MKTAIHAYPPDARIAFCYSQTQAKFHGDSACLSMGTFWRLFCGSFSLMIRSNYLPLDPHIGNEWQKILLFLCLPSRYFAINSLDLSKYYCYIMNTNHWG